MQSDDVSVAIIGAGPAGLMVAHILAERGIDSVILEARSRAYCEQRVRAGLLEAGSVKLLEGIRCADRLHAEAMVHEGTFLRFQGRSHRFDFAELTGSVVTIYGQQEIVTDMIAARVARSGAIEFDVSDVMIEDVASDRPRVRYRDAAGNHRELRCAYVAGCDGFHGISRGLLDPIAPAFYDHEYPFAWLGTLAEARPLQDELVYVHTGHGFALFTMRSPTVARNYLQVAVDERIENWSDDRIWTELERRLAGDAPPPLHAGRIVKKEITPMRSFVAEPMRYGHLLIAGDAAHIVPPTGAKGMNLALGDAALMACCIAEAEAGQPELLATYSDVALERVWKAERFSAWMTQTMHVSAAASPFDQRLQLAELAELVASRAASTAFAQNYVGAPYAVSIDRIFGNVEQRKPIRSAVG